MSDATHLYAIALGSNRRHVRYGAPSGVIAAAIAQLDHDFSLFDASAIVLNPAIGNAGRDFANAVALIETSLDPQAVLARLKGIERNYGRRPGRRWAARVLDLDILAWTGGQVALSSLTVPHPRLAERAFAIGPLAAIAPGWRLIGPLTARHLATRLARRRPRR
ncbi:MAG: 2-amino-4-hydroxy-6-hydroxymethyldihydropteridine diphosphokinase [Sphingomicrobium sp.]